MSTVTSSTQHMQMSIEGCLNMYKRKKINFFQLLYTAIKHRGLYS